MSTPSPILPQEPAGTSVPPAGQVPTASSPAVAVAVLAFTPLTAPRPRATGGWVAIVVITSILVALLAIATLMAAGTYSMKSKDPTGTREELDTTQQELQEAQKAAK